MKLRVSASLFSDNGRAGHPTDELLRVPPRYVDEAPRPYGGSVVVPDRFACEHSEIDAIVEWDEARERFVVTAATCERCAREATEVAAPAKKPREFRAKITGWHGTHGFAVPLRGEADDVSMVYVGAGSVCRHIGEHDYPVAIVQRGTIATMFDVTPPHGRTERHNVRRVECDACVAQRREWDRVAEEHTAEKRRHAIAEKRIDALFASGYRFDTGREYPSFYRTGIALSPHLGAFRVAAQRAAMEGADDETIKARAVAAARAELDRSGR